MLPAAKNLVDEFTDRTDAFSESDLVEMWQLLATRVAERLQEGQLIDLAARVMAGHPGLRGQDRSVRSFLATAARWRSLVEHLAGEPHKVVDVGQLADDSLKQARLAGEAVAAIWNEELLTSPEAARRLGAKPSNREKVNSYRRRSLLLGVPRDGGQRYLYPAFQIDTARQEIFPGVSEVNQLLDAAGDPWGVASWWISVNGRLGSRPMDRVGEAPASVVEAARAMLEPVG